MMRAVQMWVVFMAVLVSTACQIQAVVLVETPGPYLSSSGRPSTVPSFGILARVDVSGSDVAINQISVFGDATSDLDLKWIIFANATGSGPLYQTASIGVSSIEAAGWIDSPVFASFSLLANQTYWIGAAVSGPTNSFRSYFNSPGTSTSSSGLTLPAGVNGNIRTSYANPTLGLPPGTVQSAIRLHRLDSNTVPEPKSLTIWGLSLLCMILAARCRLRDRVTSGATFV